MRPHNPLLLTDFYKIGHVAQYPPGTEAVYSTWIPRDSRLKGVTEVVHFGLQAFIAEYLVGYFNDHFFTRPTAEVVAEYEDVIRATLGIEPDSTHIRQLHELGYLPLCIMALAEGTRVPLRVPVLTIENTVPHAYWLTNAIETLLSCQLWQASTSATIAFEFRQILDAYAKSTVGDTKAVSFQGHDFSMRGMPGLDAAALSGAGHLLSFAGTDSIPAILLAQDYYGADLVNELIGTSIPATEHSVMSSYGQDELTSFRRLITEVYPAGFVSIVSDTWDLWHVLTKVLPELRDVIMARDGRVVIRPDSGDPVKIICGDPLALEGTPAHKGVIQLLWDTFGGTLTKRGFRQLDSHIGAIYGDAITLERCEEICQLLAIAGFASTNMVYGIGSFTYQYVTRDTFSWALKSTWARINGEEVFLAKDPITDPGHVKKSLTGRVAVVNDHGELRVIDKLQANDPLQDGPEDQLICVFHDGVAESPHTFAEIRERLGAIT